MRAMQSIQLYSGYSSGSYGAVVTSQVNFPRSDVFLETSTSGGVGAGTHKAGIKAFQGAEGSDFGDWQNWPNSIFTRRCHGVTFGVVGPGPGDTVALCNVFFW
jgi:hypothetical protein